MSIEALTLRIREVGLADHQCAGTTQLGTRGRRCTTTWTASGDLRRAVRIRVIMTYITMLNRVGAGRARDDAVLVASRAYRYATTRVGTRRSSPDRCD